MLSIRVCKDFGHSLGNYLRQADYYSQSQQVDGICFGRLCEPVGIKAGDVITDDQFAALAQNHHAQTGEQLTERMASDRRAGFDAAFSASKSVSIQFVVDPRIMGAHVRAVTATLPHMERFACRQEGQGMNKRYVPTGQVAGAVFCHAESRALDPHLHSHGFTFNFTWDDGRQRFVALETADIFERTKFLTEVYRNHLAAEVCKLGYQIEKAENGFELVGVPPALLKRFSKRAEQRDAAVADREKEIGRSLSRNEIAILVRENRQKKMYELSPEEVRAHQLEQITAQELAVLEGLRSRAPTNSINKPSLAACIEQAKEHSFERQSVVDDYALAAEVIRASYGSFSIDEINAALVHGRHGLIVVDGRVSTQAAIEHERSLIAQINAGIGGRTCLGKPMASGLSQEQAMAVQQVLSSCDETTVLRGKAGSGKTTSLAAVIEGCAVYGREVACFAPSTKAVEILQRDGAEQMTRGRRAAGESLAQASTIQRLLVDPAMQDKVAGKVLVVDEYGLLSTRDFKRLLDLAHDRNCRLLLVGDAAQHTSVEASAAARVIERESRVTVAEIGEIRRQASNPGYLLAAKALAAGDVREGLRFLDAMGAVVEIPDAGERRAQMVDEWFAATFPKNKPTPQSTLMVAPTWDEIHALNDVARAKLRESGKITGEDQEFRSLWAKDMTRAEKKDATNYQPGDVLVAFKKTKQFEKGEMLTVVERNNERLTVRNGNGEELSISPRQAGPAYTVCEERPIPVAAGDQLRLRAIGHCLSPDGKKRRVANGTMLTAAGIDGAGRVLMPDGSVLLSHEVVHGYATTSHAAQGATVDSVFMAGAMSQEGLYVSATRGRHSIRVFTPDRVAFLEGVSLKSEDRMSALEFERLAATQASKNPTPSLTESFGRVRTALVRQVGFGRNLAVDCLRSLQPWWLRLGPKAVQASLQAADEMSAGRKNE